MFLTHDGGNGVLIPLDMKRDFLYSIRRTYDIPEDSWLISGHTHFPFVDYGNKESSLGCFNFDSFKHHKTTLSFGIITIKGAKVKYELFDFGAGHIINLRNLFGG